MITTKLYEDKNGNFVAVVLEDGQYSNYIPCPEMTAIDANSFLEEARLGFPDALPYEPDILVGLTMEKAAAREEHESVLIAQTDEKITIYPRRMNPESQEFFQIELGYDVWHELLERTTSSSDSVELEF